MSKTKELYSAYGIMQRLIREELASAYRSHADLLEDNSSGKLYDSQQTIKQLEQSQKALKELKLPIR